LTTWQPQADPVKAARFIMERVIGKLMDKPEGLPSESSFAPSAISAFPCRHCIHTEPHLTWFGPRAVPKLTTPVLDMVSMPEMPQTKVNKCLIALVGKKVVAKVNVGVSNALASYNASICS
jgi:hypothetical protein